MGHARVAPQPRRMDPTEENDADDEGEIWYNPIPEDDEPELTTRPPARLQVPATADPQRRPSRGGEAGRTQEGCSVSGLERVGECLGGGGGDGSQGNAVHSMEIQLHRQTLACKPLEEGPPGRATGIDCPFSSPARPLPPHLHSPSQPCSFSSYSSSLSRPLSLFLSLLLPQTAYKDLLCQRLSDCLWLSRT